MRIRWIDPLVILLILTTCLDVISTSTSDQTSDHRLVISPSNAVIRRPVKKGFFLTCKGDGAKPDLFTDLEWFDPNGEEVTPTNYRNSKITVKSDAEKLLLIFKEPSANDGGTYTCRGKFQFTEPLSASAEISFYQDVIFEDCPTAQSLVKGRKDGYIKCAVSANPPPIISWSKDDREVSKDERYVIENHGIRVRDEVRVEDAGRYDVSARVEETGEVLYQFITVEVYVTPYIDQIIQERDATEGEEVTLTCRTSGVPSPLVTWFDPQKRNLSEVGGYYVDRNRGTVTITKVRRYEDSGLFTCLAQNAAGEHEKSHNLIVITRPVVTSFQNITAVAFNEAIFECRATGIPPPKLTIRQDGEELSLIPGRDRVLIEERHAGDEVILITTISNVQRRDDGLYYCSAENKGGIADRVGHMTVEYAPDLSKSVSVVKTWESNPVNLTCFADAIPNATISWIWRGQRLEEINNPSFRVMTEKGVSNLLVKPLGFPGAGGADVFGVYRCEAMNPHGRSEKEIKLERAYPPSAPGPIVVLRSTPTILEFEIASPLNDGGLPVRRLVVNYRKEHFDEPRTYSWPATGGPYKLEGLIPRMSYMIKFAAENDVGVGYWTNELRYIMPYESFPERVEFMTPDPLISPESGDIRSSSPHEFLVQWTKPQSNGRAIDEYKIKYFRVIRSETGWKQVSKSREEIVREKLDLFYYKIHPLDPDSFYRIEITAHNAIGWSEPSGLVVRTAAGSEGSAARFLNDSATMGLVIGLIILGLIVILIMMDVVFYFKYRSGALYFLRNNLCQTSPSSDDHKEKGQQNGTSGHNNGTHQSRI